MSNQIIDMKEQLRAYKFQNNVLQEINCSKAENKEYMNLIKNNQPLPEGIYCHKTESGDQLQTFYKIHESGLTRDEINEYLMYKHLEYLNTIKNCLIFFVVITIIVVIASFMLYGK